MSVIANQRESQSKGARSQSTKSPVIGKVSIGRPATEPVLVEHSHGLTTRFGESFDDGTKISKGTTIRDHHIEKMQDAGMKEVQVVYGSSPTTLNHFRVLRKSNISDGYVEDPGLYDRFDLEPGDTLTELPIMLTSEKINDVLQTRMVNFDRDANTVFCSSSGGRRAMRRRTDGDADGEGDYLPSGAKKEVECVPFYWDDRVENGEKEICQFRETTGSGRECQFTGSLYFQILNEAGDFDLGRYFKIETTSSRSAEYYMDALQDIKNESQFERISFVPLKLEIVKEQTVRPGDRYEERKRASVFRTTISVDSRYVKKYKPVVKEMVETMKEYRAMNADLGIDSSSPVEIPDENPAAEEPDRWEAEFNPDNFQKKMEEEGITEAAKRAEEQGPETPQLNKDAGDGAGGEDASRPAESPDEALSGGAYELKRDDLINKARSLPPEKFDRFIESLDRVNESTIDKFRTGVERRLEGFSEEEKDAHFEANKQKDIEDEGEELPFG
jgi:phage terminase small subunit